MIHKTVTAVTGVLAAVLVSVGISAGAASADTPGELMKGQRLEADVPLHSLHDEFQLIMQSDGNLVEYRTRDWKVLWTTHTDDEISDDVFGVIDSGGSLVAYVDSQPVWNSQTKAEGATTGRLVVEDSGRMVLYRDGVPVWQTPAASEVSEEHSYSGSTSGYDSEYGAVQWAEVAANREADQNKLPGEKCDPPTTKSAVISAYDAPTKLWAAKSTKVCYRPF